MERFSLPLPAQRAPVEGKGPRNAPNLGLNSWAEGFLKHAGQQCLACP